MHDWLLSDNISSFGFGGTNAHAILESFGTGSREAGTSTQTDTVIEPDLHMLPFVFSAASEQSLLETLKAYRNFISTKPNLNLRDLAWTLSTKRSALPVKCSISAFTAEDLLSKLEQVMTSPGEGDIFGTPGNLHSIVSSASFQKPRLLGIFTGQGAQWATMGSHLLRHSSIVSDCFDTLQQSLDALPPRHAPDWSLKDELLKQAEDSRIGQASFSQPLCTAVQIALWDLLKAAGVTFATVIGHSSGEIAAAYAARHLSATDAIRIAYYRGYFLDHVDEDGTSPKVEGAMLAAGTTYEDALELCELPSLQGKVCIAARNSPESVTLSGDADAIQETKEILEDENKFARLLRVDRAYHSHHMLAYGSHYEEALKDCGILAPERHIFDEMLPTWVSSVTGEDIRNLDSSRLAGSYWKDNMLQTVLFSQAIECAVGPNGDFQGAVELGPHPALKGPTSDTIYALTGRHIPYVGTLSRRSHDVEAMSRTLGSLWKLHGAGTVDFDQFDKAMYGEQTPARLIKGLPSYAWDHDRIYWHQSRSCEAFRTSIGCQNWLLGTLLPDGSRGDFRFKNRLSVRELPWLAHHQIQGEIVFPASGYISAAVEAVNQLYSIQSVKMIQFSKIVIGKAVILPSTEAAYVETMLSFRVVEDRDDYIEILFTYSSASEKDIGTLSENMSAELRLIRGLPSNNSLPSPHVSDSRLFLDLEPERFYGFVQDLGHGYQGGFRGMSQMTRKINEAAGLITVSEEEADPKLKASFIVDPAVLDCAIQALLLAYSYPGDGRMTSLHVPTKIERLSLDVSACQESMRQDNQIPFYASAAPHSTDQHNTADIVGDVELHNPGKTRTIVQLQGLHATPLFPPSPENDVQLFFETTWAPEIPVPNQVAWESDPTFADEHSLSLLTERVSYFYIRKLASLFPQGKRGALEWHHSSLMNYVDHCISWVETGTHPYVRKEYNQDSEACILDICQK